MNTKKILREALSKIGRLGGRASARSLTPQQRTARARKAGLARQAKARRVEKKGGARRKDRYTWFGPEVEQKKARRAAKEGGAR